MYEKKIRETFPKGIKICSVVLFSNEIDEYVKLKMITIVRMH